MESSRLLKKSSATRGSKISLCNLCGSLCLGGKIAPKTFTTEAQSPLRSHREEPIIVARLIAQLAKRSDPFFEEAGLQPIKLCFYCEAVSEPEVVGDWMKLWALLIAPRP